MENSASAFGKTTWYSPTKPAWPLSAAITRGVLPLWSTESTFPPLASRSCRQSTWSLKAAAWTGVLQFAISDMDVREIFNWASKSYGIASFLIYFALIGLKKFAPLFQPIKCKTKTNHDSVARVVRRFSSLVGFTLTFHWLLNVFSYLFNGRCHCFGLGYMAFYRKAL